MESKKVMMKARECENFSISQSCDSDYHQSV